MMNREQRDKAVAIAKDILGQLKAENSYTITEGVYFRPTSYDSSWFDSDLRDHIDEVQPGCQVCMLGAAVISKARLFDAVRFGEGGYIPIRDSLIDVFDMATLDRMEAAFELTTEFAWETADDFDRGAAVFGKRYATPEDRAAAVAQNIIDNDGLFVVEPVTQDDYDDFGLEHDDEDREDDL